MSQLKLFFFRRSRKASHVVWISFSHKPVSRRSLFSTPPEGLQPFPAYLFFFFFHFACVGVAFSPACWNVECTLGKYELPCACEVKDPLHLSPSMLLWAQPGAQCSHIMAVSSARPRRVINSEKRNIKTPALISDSRDVAFRGIFICDKRNTPHFSFCSFSLPQTPHSSVTRAFLLPGCELH